MTRKFKDPQDAVIHVARDVSQFLMDMSLKHAERGTKHAPPHDDFIYAEALIHWEINGRKEGDIFSTDDKFMLEFAQELTAKFGLPVLTHEEAKKRKQRGPFNTLKVTGIPDQTKLLN